VRYARYQALDGSIRFGLQVEGGLWQPIAGDPFLGGSLEPAGEPEKAAALLAPLDPPVIWGIGLNYRLHAIESGLPIPERPVAFMKNLATLNHDGGDIVLPACANGSETDYEVELAVVIGRDAKDVSEKEALDYVFGYTVANDVSARWWQLHGCQGQWVRGKCFDTFTPLGPCLVTSDEITDPQDLKLSTKVNGQVMQDGHTGDMIFTVAQIVSFLSQDTTLLAGSVILTGTPSGVGMGRTPVQYLEVGDRVEVTVENIGTLSNPVVAKA